ncbi:CU044_5270 family protein [Streptomyces sp. NBC_01766]|uniref:CU044_5270 family protein n=1 Tax=Streptomyces sp. NBC_01766 TaxID=2975936 RepID=UPI002DD989DC|nr:CU044_5270 family protein [Streptomyces sp. NBC_01766]WSC24388.1 CU044_5270 family protein [Streptomyces sp. NBC_01766]
MNREDAASPENRNDDEARHLAWLLPPPVTEDLSPERFRHQKELLMNHIDADSRRDRPAQPTTRPTSRLLRPALLVPVSAMALAGILAGGFALGTDDKDRTTTATATQGTGGLLHHLSTVALTSEAPVVRDDQFLYTRSKVREAEIRSDKTVLSPLTETESWAPQDPRPLKKIGLTRVNGKDEVSNAQLGDDNGTPAGLSRPTYDWLASLPTDPDELLAYLRTHVRKDAEQEIDQTVFEQIGVLLGGVLPPKTAATLYRAAANIPGVREAPDAKDAIGRTGLGIAREDTKHGDRTEWVFDKDDYSFLGSRQYRTKDAPYAKAGTLLYSTAEMEHAIVDKAGQVPGKAPESTGKQQAG